MSKLLGKLNINMDYVLIFTEFGPRTVNYKLLSGMVHSNAKKSMQLLRLEMLGDTLHKTHDA